MAIEIAYIVSHKLDVCSERWHSSSQSRSFFVAEMILYCVSVSIQGSAFCITLIQESCFMLLSFLIVKRAQANAIEIIVLTDIIDTAHVFYISDASNLRFQGQKISVFIASMSRWLQQKWDYDFGLVERPSTCIEHITFVKC